MVPKQIQRGFTLIEVMITLLIIGILASIAYPSYVDYVREGRRSEGIALMSNIMNAQERYFIENRQYVTTLDSLGYASSGNIRSESGWYLVSAEACAGIALSNCVNIVAVAQNDQAQDGNLSLNSFGQRTGNW